MTPERKRYIRDTLGALSGDVQAAANSAGDDVTSEEKQRVENLITFVMETIDTEISAGRKELAERVSQGRHTIRRLHRIIKNMIDNDDGETTVLLEVWGDMEPPRMGITICAPDKDEEQIGKAMAKWMHVFNGDRDTGLAIDETKTVLSEDVKENPPWVVELRQKATTMAEFITDLLGDPRSVDGINAVMHEERVMEAAEAALALVPKAAL